MAKRSYFIGIFSIALLTLCYFLPIFRDKVFLMSSFTDDFYYYLKIAVNFNAGNGFSFVTGTPTNGYHPFYQYFICFLFYISRLFSTDTLIFMRIVLGFLFGLFSYILLRVISPKTFLGLIFFIIGLMSYYALATVGMESLVIIPALSVLFIKLNRKQLSIYQIAFYSVLCFFLRIDTIFILAPVLLYYVIANNLFQKENYSKIIRACIFSASALAIYFIYNFRSFGTFFPISGMAKSVNSFTGFHRETFEYFWNNHMPYNLVAFAAFFTFLLFLANGKKNYFILVVLFAVALLYIQNSLRSDWDIWPWYLYPFAAIQFLCADENNFDLSVIKNNLYRKSVIALTALVLPTFVLYVYKLTIPLYPNTIMSTAIEIDKFAKENAGGVYAMGDRAGVVGYLMPYPLVQLEGLVMDKNYLTNLKSNNKLQGLLKLYQAKYYVATLPEKINDSSYVITEPRQSHGYSAVIKDTISWPVAFSIDKQAYYTFTKGPVMRTVIFKVPENY